MHKKIFRDRADFGERFYSLGLLFLDYCVWFMAKNEGFRRFGSVLVGKAA
jgi:hypothetical protein